MSESAMSYATRRITEEIPHEILSRVFQHSHQVLTGGFNISRNIRSIIEDEVIRGSLNRDLQAATSKEVTIPLGGLPVRYLPSFEVAVHIPLQLTGGRVIQDVVRINYWSDIYGPVGGSPQQQVTTDMYSLLTNDVLNSSVPIAITGTSRVEMAGPNTIIANCGGVAPQWMEAVVMVEPDPEMSNVLPPMFEDYAELAILKAKALIYTKAIVNMNRGEIYAGAELGEFKNQVDRYSDVSVSYREKLRIWKSISACADTDFHTKIIRMQLGKMGR